MDDDGTEDILSGCYSNHKPMAGLLYVLKGSATGFEGPKELKGTDGKPLIVHPDLKGTSDPRLTENICTRPFAADWDGDGDLDLVVGNFKGSFNLFRRGQEGFSPQAEPVKSGGNVLKVDAAHSDPALVDWDGDGDLDLLAADSAGRIAWAENRADAGKPGDPDLAEFKTLVPAAADRKETPANGPMGSSRIWVDDLNGDRKLDVLVGDVSTTKDGKRGGHVWVLLRK